MIHYYIIWLQLLNCHVIQLIFSYFVIIYFSFFLEIQHQLGPYSALS